MSESSEDEDLSRFREFVDTSFTKLINESRSQITDTRTSQEKPKSERYLEESSHYNDVKVPEQIQKRIWSKVSTIIQENIIFVDASSDMRPKKHKIKGGVKLFKSSDGFLSCMEVKDTYTEHHNMESKKICRNRPRKFDAKDENLNEEEHHGKVRSDVLNSYSVTTDKIRATALPGDYILSKEDTKYWKSRRKEKIFKYKGSRNSKLLTLIE